MQSDRARQWHTYTLQCTRTQDQDPGPYLQRESFTTGKAEVQVSVSFSPYLPLLSEFLAVSVKDFFKVALKGTDFIPITSWEISTIQKIYLNGNGFQGDDDKCKNSGLSTSIKLKFNSIKKDHWFPNKNIRRK